jgi:hypothetical protein
MADFDPRSAANEDGRPESPSLNSAANESHHNVSQDTRPVEGEARTHASGTDGAGSPSSPPADEPDDRSGLERAEEVMDHFAGKVSSLFSVWGRKLLRLTSRARESAQDFWAEVQNFRRGIKP